jgi:hypothetical protein
MFLNVCSHKGLSTAGMHQELAPAQPAIEAGISNPNFRCEIDVVQVHSYLGLSTKGMVATGVAGPYFYNHLGIPLGILIVLFRLALPTTTAASLACGPLIGYVLAASVRILFTCIQ